MLKWDVPAIDCVAFVDPRHSKVDIVQAAGRALRLGPTDKEYGVILIPVFYEVGQDVEEIAASGIFKHVFEVVRAMSDHDERLQAEINSLKLGDGKRGATQTRVDEGPSTSRALFGEAKCRTETATIKKRDPDTPIPLSGRSHAQASWGASTEHASRPTSQGRTHATGCAETGVKFD